MTITFFIPGIPRGQPRQRVGIRGKHAMTYTPKDAPIHNWKACIAAAAMAHRPLTPISGPVELAVRTGFQRPGSHYRSRKGVRVLREDAPHHYASKPDVDNVLKPIADVLTAQGWWGDDAQIWRATVEKVYGDEPGALVTVTLLEGA